MLENFKLAKFELVLTPKKTLFLPEYVGSALRGNLDSSFRQIVCFNRKISCKDCLLKERCIYSYIFEASPSESLGKLWKNTDIPRPFIVEPPLDGRGEYKRGELLKLGFILIGRAIDYLPYFILAFKELGSIGLGGKRDKYSLCSVNSNGQVVYSSKEEVIKGIGRIVSFADILQGVAGDYPKDKLGINFLTPTRLKFEERYILTPEFHIVLRNLLQRISSLSYFHCQEEFIFDFKEMIERARWVRIEKDETWWWDWERYSRRQNARRRLGGIMGRVTYIGDFESFLPLILLGKYVHVGKGTTFGLGRYTIEAGP